MSDFSRSLCRRVHELQDKCGALMAELRQAAHAADEAHARAMYTLRAQVVIKEVILHAQPCTMWTLLESCSRELNAGLTPVPRCPCFGAYLREGG